ncbi:hypothetical protein TIFTF001_025774 [Ficus carica]|uniref:Uncharacterized protein n=1 Tax=Ficus carica TaxID=3494 RepID=A0AA88AZ43_FICCA|nr:hypothetical protein TIFTF001_025774 [Ficus carica]
MRRAPRQPIRRPGKKLAELLRRRAGGCLTDGPHCSPRQRAPPHTRSRAPTIICVITGELDLRAELPPLRAGDSP